MNNPGLTKKFAVVVGVLNIEYNLVNENTSF